VNDRSSEEHGAGEGRAGDRRPLAKFTARLAAVERELRSLRPAAQGLAAFLAYVAFTFAVYALPVITRFSGAFVGTGRNDPKTFLWSLVWWPHALREGQNPLFTDLLWAPRGVDLSWVTTIPGPSLLMEPVTEAFGPLVSLNLLQLVAPPLAAWAAFLVCRNVTAAFWPALAGGYFFGFSTYLVNHQSGHINLVLVFPVALVVYLVVRHVRGTLGPVTFVAAMTGSLIALFSIFIEVFATLAIFGGLAFLGAFAFGPGHLRRPLLRTGGLIAAAYGLTGLAVTPFLVHALRHLPSEPIRSLEKASIDLLGFVLPGYTTLIGGDEFRPFTDPFTAPPAGNGAYLGIPLILILVHFAVSGWRRPATWRLLAFAGVVAVASLGPVLHVRGRPSVDLPWRLVEPIPLIHNALPDRFTMYMWLAVGLIVALWLAARSRSVVRWAAVTLAAVMILPDLSSLPYHQEAFVPPFFAEGTYRRYIRAGEIVLIIPYGRGPGLSADMMWQAETEMYFRLASGNTGFVPEVYQGPITRCLRKNRPRRVKRISPEGFIGFLRTHRIGSIVVAEGYEDRWDPLLSILGVDGVEVGGVTFYRLPSPGVVAPMEQDPEPPALPGTSPILGTVC
jgi:hypothetical protein